MTDDTESYSPDGGNVIPSKKKAPTADHAPSVDKLFRALDKEDMLREVSKYPSSERKERLRILRQQYRERSL